MPAETPRAQAERLAQAIATFWRLRGLVIEISIVQHYQDWLIRSSLTGREPCERVRIQGGHPS